MIIITTISIFIISSGVWVARKVWPAFKLCPVCAGVSGTWVWILIGIWGGWLEAESWKLVAALAVGGSVVGIAYQLEGKVRDGKALVWKVFFISFGFPLAYNLIYFSWLYVALLLMIISLIIFFFFEWPVVSRHRGYEESHIEEDHIKNIEKRMKDCC